MDTYTTRKNTDPTRTNATNLSIRYGTHITKLGRCFQPIETGGLGAPTHTYEQDQTIYPVCGTNRTTKHTKRERDEQAIPYNHALLRKPYSQPTGA